MRQMKFADSKIKFTFQKIYRLLNVKNSAHYVWKELIDFHMKSGWKFGQFDNDKHIECSFPIDDANYVNCIYAVSSERLTFRSIILPSFDEEITNDILVLASHFNGLLTFGVVKVSIKYNYVEVVYSRDVLTYSLFPGEIESDTNTHFKLTKDCFWSFTNLIETGDDPVFVFSELLRRKEEESSE
ncbi:MAG: hypothetical protein H7Z76_14870 [Methylotenera sp.]|nr:hypothetical protein [Flavobacterium sp.]